MGIWAKLPGTPSHVHPSASVSLVRGPALGAGSASREVW